MTDAEADCLATASLQQPTANHATVTSNVLTTMITPRDTREMCVCTSTAATRPAELAAAAAAEEKHDEETGKRWEAAGDDAAERRRDRSALAE